MANRFTTDSRGVRQIIPSVPLPGTPNNVRSVRSQAPSQPVYSFENPPPRETYRPKSVPPAEPGFYVVYQSMPMGRLFNSLFEDKSTPALRNFSRLNPDLEDIIKGGDAHCSKRPQKHILHLRRIPTDGCGS